MSHFSSIVAALISDATAAGRALLTAANATAQRTALSVYSAAEVDSADAAVASAAATDATTKANSVASASVPTTRTVAGVALSADVSAATLRTALAVDRALDANHVYAWRCDDAAGAGTVAAGAGGVAMTLTGSTWVQGDGGLYRGGRALHLTAGAAGADSAVSGAITPPAGSMSVELDFLLSITNGITFGTSQTGVLSLYNSLGNYVFLRLSWSSGASGFMGGWKPDASAEQATSVGALAGWLVSPGVPHHALLTITKGSGSSNGTMSLYLDGALVSTTAGIYDAGLAGGGGTWVATIASPSNTVAPLMRVGEVRISNVARDAVYARAAYASLRARA